jgi:uncharacterized protein (TIGR02270 family)
MPTTVPAVIYQHAQDCAFLYEARTLMTRAANGKLADLRRFDDRLAAHLDGLGVGAADAMRVCDAALENPTAGAVFAVSVNALRTRDGERLNRIYALAEAVPAAKSGLASAFGWVEQTQLRGVVAKLLSSSKAFQRRLGIAVCALHRVDAGRLRDAVLEGSEPELRARALRACGELGVKDLLPACMRAIEIDDAVGRFWASWAAILLGNRGGGALEVLMNLSEAPQSLRARGFELALQSMDQQNSRAWLHQLAQSSDDLRWVIQGSGIAGDPTYVPWLIKQMEDLKTARVAGESFRLITGVDLTYLGLHRRNIAGNAGGPSDDPDDSNVEMDLDEGLPWPDAERVARWWQTNGGRFLPGTRYFLGSTVTRENCLRVLKEGFQRQRILAAHYLCLLEPGTTLFEWRAPARRQQRLLATMV